jgi:hypothetical protein
MSCFFLFQDYHEEDHIMEAVRSTCPQQPNAHAKGSGGAAAGHTVAPHATTNVCWQRLR